MWCLFNTLRIIIAELRVECHCSFRQIILVAHVRLENRNEMIRPLLTTYITFPCRHGIPQLRDPPRSMSMTIFPWKQSSHVSWRSCCCRSTQIIVSIRSSLGTQKKLLAGKNCSQEQNVRCTRCFLIGQWINSAPHIPSSSCVQRTRLLFRSDSLKEEQIPQTNSSVIQPPECLALGSFVLGSF